MSDIHSWKLSSTVAREFDGFEGPILFGGTRMIRKRDQRTLNGITELAPLIRARNRDAVLIGLSPQVSVPRTLPNGASLLLEEPNNPYWTVQHPSQDVFATVQYHCDEERFLTSSDYQEMWDLEWQSCLSIIEALHSSSRSVLFAYNGGLSTEKEIRAWAERELPVILVAGSGRTADRYASDPALEHWRKRHPSVRVANLNRGSIRAALKDFRVLADEDNVVFQQCA